MTEKSPQRFLLDIVPLTRLPLGRDQSLWYEHDEALPAGTPVRIPIGRREVFGVVLSSREDIRRRGGIKLKKIIRVCRSGRFTAEQMALAAYLSDLTLTPLGTVWRQFYIPAVSERTPPKFPKKKLLLPPPLSAHLKPIFREITASFSRGKTFLLRDTPATARDGLFFHLTEKILSRPDGQVLVLLPEVLSAVLTAKRFARHFPAEQTALIHNKVSVGALSRLREEISAGKIRLIIGTRKSVFLPFAKLSLIVIDEEHEIGFKNWDAAPRFDARDAARFLSRAHSCPLLAVSAAPRLTRRVPSPLAPPPASVPLEIIDMRPPYEPSKKPKKRSRFEIISPALREALEEVLRENRQALLFVNRRGMSAFSVCTDCRALLACPNCDRALISVKEGHWECLHCDHKTSIFPRCPRCKGLFFRNIGYGTEKIQERLSKLFPQARLARVDGHSLRRVGAAEETAADFLSGKTDILIGTQMALKDWRAPELALVGILDADALLSIPDIYADCRIFAHLTNALAAVSSRGACGKVLVQTHHPDYPLFEYARRLDYDHFRRAILRERKVLRYPPYRRMVKIITRAKKEASAETAAETLRDQLLEISDGEKSIVSSVHRPLLPKLRGLYRRQILLRIKNSRPGEPLPPEIAQILIAAPPKTIVDVDPVSLV